MLRDCMQVIAQAWNTWKCNVLEEKRLRSILAKVARHWKNRVSTMFFSCISMWYMVTLMLLLILYLLSVNLFWFSMQVIAHAWNSWYAYHEEQIFFKDELTAKEESLKYGRERCHDLEKSLKDQDGTIFNLMTRIEQLETQLRGFQARKEARIEDQEALRLQELESRLQLQVSFL